nr:hypothetical protein [uncultured Rhodopila sp.]
MPDEMLYLMREMAVQQDAIDLDALFKDDLKRWRACDRKTDVKLTAFIESHIATRRLFMAPNLIGADLLRAIADRIMLNFPGFTVADPAALSVELDFLLDGYPGWRNELPFTNASPDISGCRGGRRG